MHDIKWIRDNPESFDRALERRGLPPQAQWLLGRYQSPLQRIEGLTVKAASDWAPLLQRDIGDRVMVRLRPLVGGLIEQVSIIEGLRWQVRPGEWTAEFQCSPADRYNYLVLDDTTLGRLDAGNRLAY